MAYKIETGRADFVGDWASKDVAKRHRTTTYASTYMHAFLHTYVRKRYKLLLDVSTLVHHMVGPRNHGVRRNPSPLSRGVAKML
jgi:hypothetical protein